MRVEYNHLEGEKRKEFLVEDVLLNGKQEASARDGVRNSFY